MKQEISSSQIHHSIDKGLQFLTEHQLPNGEFVTYIGAGEMLQEWAVPDSCTFMTTLIGHCLLAFSNRPAIDQLLSKSSGFLQYQMMRGGAWHFSTTWHNAFPLLPADVDDTALASAFLKERQITIPDNLPVFLANRNRSGLFYTWITLRFNFPTHMNSWLLRLRFLKAPLRSFLYQYRSEMSPNDIDPVVNANVTYYLGNQPYTQPAIQYLKKHFENQTELNADKWYHNPFIIYYFYAKLLSRPIDILEPFKPILQNRILQLILDTPNLKTHALQLAGAISSLCFLEYQGPVLDDLAMALIQQQDSRGYWQRAFVYSVPSGQVGWGSEETTTAFAVEALHLYILQKNPTFTS